VTRGTMWRPPTRNVVQIPTLLLMIALGAVLCLSQTEPDLQTYFKDYIGLRDEQIASIRSGQAVAKTLPSRSPDEVCIYP
jgi:hypothetical protein